MSDAPGVIRIADGVVLLRNATAAGHLAGLVDVLTAAAPWRRMQTPGGRSMAVEMSNCGTVGWVSDRQGYRYEAVDPLTGRSWPPMPGAFLSLAEGCAARAGFADFVPDCCLMNRYRPGIQLSRHQDRDEQDFTRPIVSVSLGLPAEFVLYGVLQSSGRGLSIPLVDGDVLVFGGPARLAPHRVKPVKPGQHPLLGDSRVNLTFRKARR